MLAVQDIMQYLRLPEIDDRDYPRHRMEISAYSRVQSTLLYSSVDFLHNKRSVAPRVCVATLREPLISIHSILS